jgi:hypothetical protein
MAAKDREILALLETTPPACGTGWLSELTRVLSSDPGAAEQALAYCCWRCAPRPECTSDPRPASPWNWR